MELAGKRVMVVGLGVSGLAAVRFLASIGAHLVMTDQRIGIDRSVLPDGELRLGDESLDWLRDIDLVVTSPGVPRDSKLLSGAVAQRIPVIGELELASRFIAAPIVAITGTNGKSTVVVMLGEILKAAGMQTFVGGNLGTPFSAAIGKSCDVAVVEVSSFQLEWIERFHPHVGVHLNLSDDHFDRYRDREDYGRAKARMFENQVESDFAILNRDDPEVWKLRTSMRSRVIGFGSTRDEALPGLWLKHGAIEFYLGHRRGRINLAEYRLAGKHNQLNAMAASAAALALNVPPGKIEMALASFKGLPHRIEFVCEKNGITFIDDSKGTNVGAAVEAIDAVRAPVILIAGGVDKGGDYAPLKRAMREKVRLAILNGAARETMRDALADATEIIVVPTLKEAVDSAMRSARPGDTVLLSPACSSFDQFKDYAERGEVFKKLVRAL
jgi:UDP-N-acetylmuramoylalanine--D-glutamate ligase